jgi:glycosyltransferase involved in cell wall biosynthesis
MTRSDIVCVPSLYEACPLGAIEAMVLEKPVVTFDRPFSRELFKDVARAAIAPSIQGYAKHLHSLCTSRDLRIGLGKDLRNQAVKRFDIDKIAQKYIELYAQMLG